MSGQIDGAEMACNIPAAKFEKTIKVKWQERVERGIEDRGRFFEKAGSEKIDIETDVSDSEWSTKQVVLSS